MPPSVPSAAQSLLQSPLALIVTIYVGVVGLFIGSFLNVVVARVPAGESIVRPRSRCPRCKHQIAWYDNIPLLSWLILRRRCRHCGEPISARYPLVELTTGVLFAAVFLHWGVSWRTFFLLVFVCLCLVLTFIDLDTWQLPAKISVPGIAVGLIYSFVAAPFDWWEGLAGAAAGFLVLFLVDELWWRLFKKEGVGFGDFFFLAMIGAFLGWRSLPLVLILSSLQGAAVGLAAIAVGKRLGAQKEAGQQHPEPAWEAPETPIGIVGPAEGFDGMMFSVLTGPNPRPAPELDDAITDLDGGVVRRIPLEKAERWEVVLLAHESDRATLGVVEPDDHDTIREAIELLNVTDIAVCKVRLNHWSDLLDRYYEWTPGAHHVPFGPFLALGALETMFFGPQLVSWYAGWLLERLL